ncbi:MAG: DUF4912 domain-containing protein [Deltaproteobacteria bacterium]|nr:DUF4912 domain-containing protein [Deltaproteobacteria bacterium]
MAARLKKKPTNAPKRAPKKSSSKKPLFPEALPLLIKANRATLLTIDPKFAFAYWELNNDAVRQATEKLGPESQLYLRFYDVTSTTDLKRCPHWDVEVFDHNGNWYLKLEKPRQKLCFEVFLKSKHGSITLSQSNIIHLSTGQLQNPLLAIKKPTAQSTSFDQQYMKRILGPYFYELYEGGRLGNIANTSLEAIFHDVTIFRHESELLPFET